MQCTHVFMVCVCIYKYIYICYYCFVYYVVSYILINMFVPFHSAFTHIYILDCTYCDVNNAVYNIMAVKRQIVINFYTAVSIPLIYTSRKGTNNICELRNHGYSRIKLFC
jgi:hypothetical protein